MNRINTGIGNFITKTLPEYSVKHNAAFLIAANAVTFSLSSGAQAASVMRNKNLPENDRKFIVKQEIIKGALDLAVFIALAAGFKKFGKALVAKGKLLPKELCGETDKEKIRKIVMDFMSGLKLNNKVPEYINADQRCAIRSHLAGAKIWTSFAGSVIAFNLITPLMKNYFADIITKKKPGNPPSIDFEK